MVARQQANNYYCHDKCKGLASACHVNTQLSDNYHYYSVMTLLMGKASPSLMQRGVTINHRYIVPIVILQDAIGDEYSHVQRHFQCTPI